jgi:hypothetical protein
MVCSTFVFAQKEGFLGLEQGISCILGGIITLATLIGFIIWKRSVKIA